MSDDDNYVKFAGLDSLVKAARIAKANGREAIVVVKPFGGSYRIGIAVVDPLLENPTTAPVMEMSLRDAALLSEDLVAAFRRIRDDTFAAGVAIKATGAPKA